MKKYYEDFVIGETAKSSSRTMTAKDIHQFAACTGNDHPIHTDPEYCRQHPLAGRCVVQGVLVLSVADGMMAQEILPDETLLIHYGSDAVRFIKPVYPEDTVHIETKVIQKRVKNAAFGLVVFQVQVINQRGDHVLVYEDIQMLQRKEHPEMPE